MADKGEGLRIERRFTTEGSDPYESLPWSRRESRITNPDGSIVFEMKDAEVPATWSTVATDIIVSKYFRKAGVPQVDESGVPITDGAGNPVLGSEQSAKDVFDRLAETWRYWGEAYGYFDTDADARTFEDEIKHMLANQMAAPNSPQWFNTGLAHKYGITGTPQGSLVRSTRRPATWPPPPMRIPGLPLMLVSSSRWRTIWSTMGASWTYGSGRRACSKWAQEPDPTSPVSAPRASGWPVAARVPV